MRRLLSAFVILLVVTPALAERVPGTQFDRLTATDGLGRTVTFYLSESATPKPLALVIQGSGCSALFRRLTDDAMSAVGYHNVFRSVGGERYRVLAVEKPAARSTDEPPVGGTAEGCPPAFLEEHTVERWAEALKASLDAARLLPGVIPGHALVVGHSEGGVLAARLARLDAAISHAALLASPGPDPIEELVAWGEGRKRPRAEMLAMIAKIRAAPDNTTGLVLGHPHRRWSSFLKADPVSDLLASHAMVFAAQGDSDANWPVVAHDTLVSRLRAGGRAVMALRIPGADHSLNAQGQRPPEGMTEVFRKIVAWTSG